MIRLLPLNHMSNLPTITPSWHTAHAYAYDNEMRIELTRHLRRPFKLRVLGGKM